MFQNPTLIVEVLKKYNQNENWLLKTPNIFSLTTTPKSYLNNMKGNSIKRGNNKTNYITIDIDTEVR